MTKMLNKLTGLSLVMVLVGVLFLIPSEMYPEVFSQIYSNVKHGKAIDGANGSFTLNDSFYIVGTRDNSYSIKEYDSQDLRIVLSFGRFNHLEFDREMVEKQLKVMYSDQSCVVFKAPDDNSLRIMAINFRFSFFLLFEGAEVAGDHKRYCNIIARQ